MQELFYSATYVDVDLDYPEYSSFYQNINTGLKPESANTFQMGFNSFRHNAKNSTLGLKALFYYSNIQNYIYDSYIKMSNSSDGWLLLPLNNKARFYGFELEAMQESTYVFTHLSYTFQHTDAIRSSSEANAHASGPGGSLSTGQTPFSQLPRHYMNLHLGLRFFRGKFVLGGIMKYTQGAKRSDYSNILWGNPPADSSQDGTNIYALSTAKLPHIPPIFDIYMVFKPWRLFEIRAEVQNLANSRYIDPLYAFNATLYQGRDAGIMANYARGRSYYLSVILRY